MHPRIMFSGRGNCSTLKGTQRKDIYVIQTLTILNEHYLYGPKIYF